MVLSGMWAWTAQMDTREFVSLRWYGFSCSMAWGGSEIFAELFYSRTPSVGRSHFSHYSEGIIPRHQERFPILNPGFSHNTEWTDLELGIRLWFLNLVYFICWLATLVWWQRRKQRFLK